MQRHIRHLLGKFIHLWRKVRYPIGYTLFVLILSYGLTNAPNELWNVEVKWLIASIVLTVILFLLQQWQVHLFLKANGADSEWLFPALFNARRGILNTVLPAKSGTLALLHTISSRYGIKWQDFLYFSIFTSILSIYISILGLIVIMLPPCISILAILVTMLLAIYVYYFSSFNYAKNVFHLLFISIAIFFTTILIFMSILRGLGFNLTALSATYFAVILNILAQVSITPANIGIREAVLASASPFLDLPISVGIIAGSILLIVRLFVYGVAWGLTELYKRVQE